MKSNITYLGKSEMTSLFGANGKMEQLERVHLAKGTKIFAFGAYMCDQEFVIYDDEMNAVEIYEGKLEDVTVDDLNNYFFPMHKIEEEVRPISKKFGIGFYYDESGELISDEVIENSLERAKILERLKQEEKEAKAKAKEELREKLIKEYPYLTQGGQYDHKICGHNLKAELKHKFPGVKFSVRYKSYTGGNDYSVSWIDGPTEQMVKDVIDKYQDHESDHTGDYWDYAPSVFNELFGGVSFIMAYRTISEGAKESIREEYNDLTEDNIKEYNFKEQDEKAVENCLRYYTTLSVNIVIEAIAKKRTFGIYETKPNMQVEAEGLEIVDYSEKAFAVIGNTKEIKEELKRLGGRFNSRLTCGAGWIFSKSKLEEVKQYLSK